MNVADLLFLALFFKIRSHSIEGDAIAIPSIESEMCMSIGRC